MIRLFQSLTQKGKIKLRTLSGKFNLCAPKMYVFEAYFNGKLLRPLGAAATTWEAA